MRSNTVNGTDVFFPTPGHETVAPNALAADSVPTGVRMQRGVVTADILTRYAGAPNDSLSDVPGNGRAIANYLRTLIANKAEASTVEREAKRADQLGTFLYGVGWSAGARRSGLGVALRYGLTVNEVRAVQYWTSVRICEVVNASLRAAQPLPEEHEPLVRILQQALARLPPYRNRTYRGTSLPASMVEKLAVGDEFVDPGFAAASKNKDIARQFIGQASDGCVPVLFTIDSRRGKDISLVGWHSELAEVEFAPGTKHVISAMAYENGILNIRLRDG